jgi:hypothetical protein
MQVKLTPGYLRSYAPGGGMSHPFRGCVEIIRMHARTTFNSTKLACDILKRPLCITTSGYIMMFQRTYGRCIVCIVKVDKTAQYSSHSVCLMATERFANEF